MERFLGSIAGRPPRELPDGARSRSRSPHGYRPPQLHGRPVRRTACPLARTAQTPGYNRPVSETEGQEPKKRGFFSRIFGGGDDSDQHKSLTKMDSLAAYVIREQRFRLLDRPDVIRAVGEDVANMTAEQVRES